MTVKVIPEVGGTAKASSRPLTLGLAEYCDDGLRVLLLVLVGKGGMICVAFLGESASVMKEDTSGGNVILL